MTRWKLTLEYDGRPFVGWQRQANGPSVQQVLEDAILRFSGETVRLHGSGRTDAGVHALAQIAHFDLETATTAKAVAGALTFHSRPWPVAILAAEAVPADFHARFSALRRSYRYRIINRRPPLTLDAGRAWQVIRPLDAGAMHDAAQLLVGRHDFSSFRASLCQAASPVKTLDRLEVRRAGAEIEISASARSFLHHQIRNIVGTLELVGAGTWNTERVRAALEARDRRHGGPTAPPDGLYFVGAFYPPEPGPPPAGSPA
ncbi:MAG: tRNA pseudouridine(38-40) synthase TruA [Rhodospirillaceae bacterium]